MSLVSNKNKKIFLYKNRKITINTRVDIILSPEFYWVRVFDIPVKSIAQARSVLPSLFEDIVNEKESLSYKLIKKEDNKYLCFAYSNKRIFEQIRLMEIPNSLINAVYFAQTECMSFKSFSVDNISFTYTKDDILVKVPKELSKQSLNLDEKINNINLTNHKVDIKFYNNVIKNKYIYYIATIFILLSIFNLVQIIVINNDISKVEGNILNIKDKYSLSSSLIQRKAILKNFDKNINEEYSKREALEYILSNKNLNLESISLENDILFLKIKGADTEELKAYISKKYELLSSRNMGLFLDLRIKI